MPQAFQLISGPAINDLLTRTDNRLGQLLEASKRRTKMVDELYWTALTRAPDQHEARRAGYATYCASNTKDQPPRAGRPRLGADELQRVRVPKAESMQRRISACTQLPIPLAISRLPQLLQGRRPRACSASTMPGFSMREARLAKNRGCPKPRAKSVIFLFQWGGPSHIDMFDMKPDAPEGIRGPHKPIRRAWPTASRSASSCRRRRKLMDKVTLIRSHARTR